VPAHLPYARDDASGGRIPVVEILGCQRGDLEERRAVVEQGFDAIARQ
jgi:hypothetical protein